MILLFINICKLPRKMLKTEGEARGFQHFPRDLANVNEWKFMFDHSIGNYNSYIYIKKQKCVPNRKCHPWTLSSNYKVKEERKEHYMYTPLRTII